MLHLDLSFYETTDQHEEVQFRFKLRDHSPHSRLQLLVNRGLLLSLPRELYLELVSWRYSPWEQYIVAARYLCVGCLS